MPSSLTEQHPVAVVGGGIGGVAMALALGRQGHRVQLLEQADQIGAIGYGVQMGPNVMPMLDELVNTSGSVSTRRWAWKSLMRALPRTRGKRAS